MLKLMNFAVVSTVFLCGMSVKPVVAAQYKILSDVTLVRERGFLLPPRRDVVDGFVSSGQAYSWPDKIPHSGDIAYSPETHAGGRAKCKIYMRNSDDFSEAVFYYVRNGIEYVLRSTNKDDYLQFYCRLLQ